MDDQVQAFTPKEKVIINVARHFFWFFLEHIFIRSFDGQTYLHDDGTRKSFSFGKLHMEWALLAQFHPRLCVMAPRAHLKSTVLAKAFAFWQMFKVEENHLVDILYFSYKSGLAIEQVEDLLKLIQANPYCRYWRDQRPQSRTMIDYLVDFGDGIVGEATLKGDGIMSATRGRHPKVTICDDILSDFSNPLSSTDLERINRVFRQSIMSLPANPDDPLLVVGTPQSFEDVLYSLASSEEWMWLMYPAIIDEKNRITQWPEKFTYERLIRSRRNMGSMAFEVEYQLSPVRVADQFFTREEILKITDLALPRHPLGKEFEKSDLSTYAGCDVGRMVHPSHVTVFVELPNGTLVQVFQQFLDHMRYPDQIKLLNQVAKTFRLSRGYYDATYNVLDDRGLDNAWRGRPFNRKLKADMATLFEKRVLAEKDEAGIVLLNDPRQLNQITVVDKQLKAATTIDGHGDAFWSIGLAIKACDDGPGMVELGSGWRLMDQPYSPSQTWARQISSM